MSQEVVIKESVSEKGNRILLIAYTDFDGDVKYKIVETLKVKCVEKALYEFNERAKS